MVASVIRKAYVPLHPRRARKISALYKSKALKPVKKMINYCRAGFELIFPSSEWSNSEHERRGRHRDQQTYCHSDWCLDKRIKQAEFICVPRNRDKCPDHSTLQSTNAKWMASFPVALWNDCRIRPGVSVCAATWPFICLEQTSPSGCSRCAGAEEAGIRAR